MLRLNAEWTEVLRRYKEDHQDPRNQACHKVGIPLIVASFPVGATLIGLPLAAAMFTAGWGFQFAGHYFEGKKPSFVDDKRSLIVGVLWCLEKYGLRVFEETPAP
ncbi:Mpo1-like protein [Sorangium sp. So ce590]|uniref:Mpo1-like protein n=1 Tax=unclassified Sorangium TaxID=2621164 RepID=UPI003F608EAB